LKRCSGINPSQFRAFIEYKDGKNIVTAKKSSKARKAGDIVAEIGEDGMLRAKSCAFKVEQGRCRECDTLLRCYLYQMKRARDTRDKTPKKKQKTQQNTNDTVLSQLDRAVKNGDLSKESFIYSYLQNLSKNISKSPQGYRHSEEMIQFCCLLKFHGGSRTLELLRGDTKNGHNFLLPSDKTIRQYLPQIQFNNGEIDVEDFANSESKCNDLVLSYDEIEIRSGLVYHPHSNQVIGFCGSPSAHIDDVEKQEMSEQSIASKIIQFFLWRCDGSGVKPVCHYGHYETKDAHIKQVMDTFSEIQQKLDESTDGKLKIKVIASDRYDGNFEVGRQAKEKGTLKVEDFWHLIKNLRNAILKTVSIHNVEFGLYLFRDIKHESKYSQFSIDENYYAPEDKMNTEVIERMLNQQLIHTLTEEQREELRYLGEYLQFMAALLNLFVNTEHTTVKKLEIIAHLLKTITVWFGVPLCEDPYSSRFAFSACMINPRLFTDIIITLNTMKSLLSEAKDYKVNPCVVNSNLVENYFSIICSKNRYVSADQYTSIARYADIALQNRFFHNAKYNYNYSFNSKSHKLARNTQEYRPLVSQRKNSKNSHPTQSQKEKGDEVNNTFKPKKRTALIRDVKSKTLPTDRTQSKVLEDYENSVEVACPYFTNCGKRIPFRNHSCFKRHLKEAHSMNTHETKRELYEAILKTLDHAQGFDTQEQELGTQERQTQESQEGDFLIKELGTMNFYKSWKPTYKQLKKINKFKRNYQLIALETQHTGADYGHSLLEVGAIAISEEFTHLDHFSKRANPQSYNIDTENSVTLEKRGLTIANFVDSQHKETNELVNEFNDWVNNISQEKTPVFLYYRGDEDHLFACLNNNINMKLTDCIDTQELLFGTMAQQLRQFNTVSKLDPLSQASQLASLLKTSYGNQRIFLEFRNKRKIRKKEFSCLDHINPTISQSKETLKEYTHTQLNHVMKYLCLNKTNMKKEDKVDLIITTQNERQEKRNLLQSQEYMLRSISLTIIEAGGRNTNFPYLTGEHIKKFYFALSNVIKTNEFLLDMKETKQMLTSFREYNPPPFTSEHYDLDPEANIRVLSDGNQIFRCLSLYFFGFEDAHVFLRYYASLKSEPVLSKELLNELATIGLQLNGELLASIQTIFGLNVVISSITCVSQENNTVYILNSNNEYAVNITNCERNHNEMFFDGEEQQEDEDEEMLLNCSLLADNSIGGQPPGEQAPETQSNGSQEV
jgi:hypothetical protein